MSIDKLRKFLMEWVLPPRGIRVVCYLMSKCVRGTTTISRYRRRADRLFVLANGPSLKKDLERYGEEMLKFDRIVVNFMGNTDVYFQVKPTLYVLADPVFFVPRTSLPEAMRAQVDALQKTFVERTDWPMTLVVPGGAASSELVVALKANPKLSVLVFFGGVPVPEDIVDFAGWSRNRYAPPTQNIVNVALYLGIVWRYPEIVLLGADTSFHAMVRVEQETNRLYTMDEHFYGTTKRYMYQDPECKVPQTMCGFFPHVLRAFKWYAKLREFADWAGVKIVNASSFSWIDSFERPAFPSARRMS